MKPLLSIVIPTKNRQKYCLAAINQILSLHLKSFEICIQDNSDSNSLLADIELLNDEHIIYNYHEGVLSFVDNFSEAVSLCSGEYLCMIGDDDGILGNIDDVLQFAISNSADAIIPAIDYAYYWPTDKPLVAGGENGYLLAPKLQSSPTYLAVNPILDKLLQNAGQDYQKLNLPRLYHGLVKRSCMDAIKKRTGVLFDGLTPDIYIAAALLQVCKLVYKTNISITISGVCPTSGSADSDTGRHTGSLSSAPHFRGHSKYHWYSIVPYVYCVETIWAETLLHVLDNFGLRDRIHKFNVSLLDSICYYSHKQLREPVLMHARQYNISQEKMLFLYIKYKLPYYLHKILQRIKRNLGFSRKVVKYFDVLDIQAAHNLIINNK